MSGTWQAVVADLSWRGSENDRNKDRCRRNLGLGEYSDVGRSSEARHWDVKFGGIPAGHSSQSPFPYSACVETVGYYVLCCWCSVTRGLTVSVWPFSSPGLTSWHLVRSTWRTSGPLWRQRWLSRWPSPPASPSPGLMPPSLPPSSHHSWEELWSSTPRKTRAWTCSQYLVRPPAGDWGQGTVLWSLEHCL